MISPTHPGPSIGRVIALAVFLRLALFLIVQPWSPATETRFVLSGDGRGYHDLATTLLSHHRFAYSATAEPNSLRTPGYPIFVAATYAIFGARPWVVLLAQIALDALSCLLLYSLVVRRFGARPAWFAVLFFALDPFLSIFSSARLISDTLFVFLLLWSIWLLERALAPEFAMRSLEWVAWSGLVLALGVLTRPVAQFLVIVYLGIVLLAKRGTGFAALRHAAVMAIVFGAVLAPVLIRNQVVLGRFALSSSDSYNLLILSVAPMEMQRHGRDMHEAKRALLAEADSLALAENSGRAPVNDLQLSVYWRRLALSHIRRDPAGFARAYAKGIVHMFGNLGTSVFSSAFGWPQTELQLKRYANFSDLASAFIRTKGPAAITLAVAVGAYLLLTYVLGIVGLWTAVRHRDLLAPALVALAIGGYFVAITGAAGLARFKMPAIPAYVVFAGLGLVAFLDRRSGSPPSAPRH